MELAELFGTVSSAILLVLAVGIYLLPTIVGFIRRKRNRVFIALINVLLGWTVIGWGAMIVESFKRDDAP